LVDDLDAAVLKIQLPNGATVVPVIISTDKTQLCQFTGGKTAYPVYMTIGNIEKSIQRKPSYHAQTFVGYLPTATLNETDLNDTTARMGRSRLFHKAMATVFAPLKVVAKSGIELTIADGALQPSNTRFLPGRLPRAMFGDMYPPERDMPQM